MSGRLPPRVRCWLPFTPRRRCRHTEHWSNSAVPRQLLQRRANPGRQAQVRHHPSGELCRYGARAQGASGGPATPVRDGVLTAKTRSRAIYRASYWLHALARNCRPGMPRTGACSTPKRHERRDRPANQDHCQGGEGRGRANDRGKRVGPITQPARRCPSRRAGHGAAAVHQPRARSSTRGGREGTQRDCGDGRASSLGNDWLGYSGPLSQEISAARGKNQQRVSDM